MWSGGAAAPHRSTFFGDPVLGKLLIRYLQTYRWLLAGRLDLPVHLRNGLALPPAAQRRHHRPGRRPGRHRLHLVAPACSCSRSRSGRSSRRSSPRTSPRAPSMAAGRDIRSDVYEKVSGFSEREVSQFGRRLAHHPQHQRRAAGADARDDGRHDARHRAAARDRRHHHGAAAGRRARAGSSPSRCRCCSSSCCSSSAAWCRCSAASRGSSTPSTASCASSSPASASCAPSCARTSKKSASAVANTDIMVVGRKVGSLFVLLFPLAHAGAQRHGRRRHLVRRHRGQQRHGRDRHAVRVHAVHRSDPDGRPHGELHDDHDPARRRLGRAHRRGARERVDTDARRRTPSPSSRRPEPSRSTTRVHLPRRRVAGAAGHHASTRSPARPSRSSDPPVRARPRSSR